MLIRLHHAQLTIPKGAEEECRRFYCGLLGLVETPKPASLAGRGGFWLELGEIQIHVGTEENVNRAATKAHLAYEVDDLDGWRAKLEERHLEILEGIPIPGYDRFEFRDPFGNRVEFLQRLN
ncbi:MAG TPA: VOC family protein [Pyrinomonadaceae bacterium]|jgi:catechol 2,3-dioxygenase-like lactoylglutathione lyase family enzyme